MPAILADVNLDGHARRLDAVLGQDPTLNFYRRALQVVVLTFSDVPWDRTIADDDLWRGCQAEGYLLLTANRNHDGPRSLEATIRQLTTATSLPVFTLSDADRFLVSGEYAHRVATRLMEYLAELSGILGTGRLFVP